MQIYRRGARVGNVGGGKTPLRVILRRMLEAALVVLVVLALAVFAAARLIDVDAWRDDLAATLSDRLGLDVRIQGRMQLEVGPVPCLVVSNVEIHEPGTGGARPIARFDVAALSADLIRSYREGRVVISQVRASGVTVALVRDADGVGNWQLRDRLRSDDASSGVAMLSLEEVVLEDARLTYETAVSDWAFDLDIARLDLSAPAVSSRLEARARGVIQGQAFEVDFTSDSNEIERRGIFGDRTDIQLDASARVGPVEIAAVGRVENPRGQAQSDLMITLHMDDLGDVRQLAHITEKVNLAGIGALDLRGRLVGGGGNVRLDDIVGTIAGDSTGYLEGRGRIGDLVRVADIDLALVVSSPDAAGVTARLRIPRPEVRQATGTGRLRGRWPEIKFEEIEVESKHRLGGTVRVSGEVARIGKDWSAGLDFEVDADNAGDVNTMVEEVVASLRRGKEPIRIGRPDLQLHQIVMAMGPAHVTGRVAGRARDWELSSVSAHAGRGDVDWLHSTGGIASLAPVPSGVAFDIEAGSDDLGALIERADVPVRGLERLRLSGRMVGDGDHLIFERMQALSYTPDKIVVGLSGDVPMRDTIVGTELLVAISAQDLSIVGDVIDRRMPVLGPIEMSAEVLAEDGALVWRDAVLGIGSSLITGEFRVEQGPERPRVTAVLASDRVRLRDVGLEPASPDDPARTEAHPDYASWLDRPVPFEDLLSLDGELELRVASLVGRGGVDVADIALRVHLDDGILAVDDLTLVYQGGHMEVGIDLDVSVQPPEMNLRLAGDGLRIEQVIAQFVEERLADGSGQVVADLDSRGITARELAANLDGDMFFYGRDGGLAMRYSHALQLDLGSGAARRAAAGELEPFECLIVDASARNGVVTLETVLFDTKEKQVLGSGDVDLAKDQMDVLLTPIFKRTIPGSVATAVRLQGPIREPDITPAPFVTAGATAQGIVDRALFPLNRILPGVGIAVDEVRRSADRAIEGTGVTLPDSGLWRPGIDMSCEKVLRTERIEALRSDDTVQPG